MDGLGRCSCGNASALKRAIAEGKIVIVAVGWETNKEILDKLRDGEQPLIGHYMVVVGYDAKHVYVLNPGYNPDEVEKPSFPQQIPWEQFLQDWSKGNFAIEANSLWAIEGEPEK